MGENDKSVIYFFFFSGNFVACDLKVSRYIQLIKLIKLCEYPRSSPLFELCQRSFTCTY